MSDLVGNPEDRFSHNRAHFSFEGRVLVLIVPVPGYGLSFTFGFYNKLCLQLVFNLNKLRHEKTYFLHSSCVDSAQLISVFVFATEKVPPTSKILSL